MKTNQDESGVCKHLSSQRLGSPSPLDLRLVSDTSTNLTLSAFPSPAFINPYERSTGAAGNAAGDEREGSGIVEDVQSIGCQG